MPVPIARIDQWFEQGEVARDRKQAKGNLPSPSLNRRARPHATGGCGTSSTGLRGTHNRHLFQADGAKCLSGEILML